jgi:hypothetical protein
MIRFRSLAVAALLIGSICLLGACSNKITPHKVRKNMSPELDSIAQNTQQDRNTYARTIDHTTRQAWDDLAWLLLLDEPLHLTEYPIP